MVWVNSGGQTMNEGQCPVCSSAQSLNLLCSACCDRLERDLRAVPGLLVDLDTAMSKQARIGSGSGGGLANERDGMGFGAMQAHDDLANCLVFWAADVTQKHQAVYANTMRPSAAAAAALLASINEIRRHPAIEELLPGIIGGIDEARRTIDRPAEREYLGTCLVDECRAEVWARLGTKQTACRECGITHDVAERRQWLLDEARPMVVTAKEASVWIGEIGGQTVSETNIRNWVGRGKIPLRPGLSTQRQFELGALLDYLARSNRHATTLADLAIAV
jgi:hypothetical protein